LQVFELVLHLHFASKYNDNLKKISELKKLADRIAIYCSAVHAYKIEETLTFVKNGTELTTYQKE
jgi:hypothetical protein